jgi:hypothetical protein
VTAMTASTLPRVELTQELEIRSTDIARIQRAARDVATFDELADTEPGELSCSLTYADALGQVVLDEARARVRPRAEHALAQLGGGARLGKLETATLGTVDVGTDCADFVITATAMATYELE